MEELSWLEKATIAGKAKYAALMAEEYAKDAGMAGWQALTKQEKTTAVITQLLQAEPGMASAPLWQATSTTSLVKHMSPTHAAILPKSPLADSELPRAPGVKKKLTLIAESLPFRHTDFIVDFLEQIIFLHHQSTSGRWNPAIGRFERYGVKSVQNWATRIKTNWYGDKDATISVSDRTFRSIKDALAERGLIVAQQHLLMGAKHLWIKPTDALSAIVFVDGHWDQVKASYMPQVGSYKHKLPKGKARGLSAIYAKLDLECRELYKAAMHKDFKKLSSTEREAIFKRLTTPIKLSEKRMKAAFVKEASNRYQRLMQALFID